MARLPTDLHRVVAVADVVGDVLRVVELVAELVEVGDLDVGPQSDAAGVGRELTEEDAEEGRLTGAVGADDADPVAAGDGRRDVVEDRLLSARGGHPLERGDERAAPFRFLDQQIDLADAVAPVAALAAHRLEGPDAPFVARPSRLDPGADPHLLLGQPLVEEGILLLLGGEGLFLALQEGVVVARPVKYAAAIDLEDPRRQPAEERPIVGHEQERPIPAPQEIFEP